MSLAAEAKSEAAVGEVLHSSHCYFAVRSGASFLRQEMRSVLIPVMAMMTQVPTTYAEFIPPAECEPKARRYRYQFMGRAYFGEPCQVNLAVLPRADDKILMEEYKSSKHEQSTKPSACNFTKPVERKEMVKLEKANGDGGAAAAGENDDKMCDRKMHK